MLDETRRAGGWEIQKTGRDEIRKRLSATIIADAAAAKSGHQCVELALPADTVGFEWVTIGRRFQPDADREYDASVWVRWADGPDDAPVKAGSTSGRRSAIVSFWARHRNNRGEFAGRDEWLLDNRWHQLKFRFRATGAPGEATFVYVSLLPNQTPAATRVLVDDFFLNESIEPPEVDARVGCISGDPDFSAQTGSGIVPPWKYDTMGGAGITCVPEGAGGGRHVAMRMKKGTSNYESAQLCQQVELREGVRYMISCRIRLDTHTPAMRAPPIVNFGIFHQASHTWYGPVDQRLERSGDWCTYRYEHVAPYPGQWKLYVQLNGWGNFGDAVGISVDDFTCTPVGK